VDLVVDVVVVWDNAFGRVDTVVVEVVVVGRVVVVVVVVVVLRWSL
jgi:hypothetical protein